MLIITYRPSVTSMKFSNLAISGDLEKNVKEQ